jgi:hypothetical protein
VSGGGVRLTRKNQLEPSWGSPSEYLHQELGLLRLQERTRSFPWANACVLVRKPDAGTPLVRFDERGVETEYGAASETPATDGLPLRHRATSRLYNARARCRCIRNTRSEELPRIPSQRVTNR